MYKLLKIPFFGRFMVKWQNPLTEAQQKEWQKIHTKSKSGGIIHGLFAKAHIEIPKATIVLGHPMGKEAKAYFIKNGYTELLRKNGYNALVFDLNGFGESTHGNFSYYEDILAIGREAIKASPNIPVGYLGISMGAQWATIAFTAEAHSYDFAVLESAATSLDDYWIKFPLPYKTLQVMNFLFPKYKKKIRPVDRVQDIKRLKSMLLIYSEIDDWTPLEMGMKLKENSRIPVELWTVRNAKHASIMKSEHKAEYERKIIEYFDKQTG